MSLSSSIVNLTVILCALSLSNVTVISLKPSQVYVCSSSVVKVNILSVSPNTKDEFSCGSYKSLPYENSNEYFLLPLS